MTESTVIAAQPRTVTGKANRRLATAGQIPAVLYGYGREAASIALDRHDFELFITHHGSTGLVEIAVEGEKEPVNAMIKAVQTSPVKGTVIHVDFLAVRMDRKIQSPVSFHFVGDAPGVRAGGVMLHDLREVLVEALPATLPEYLEVDVSALEMGDTVHVSDVVAPAGVTIVGDPEAIVCSVAIPTAEPTEEELEEAAEEVEPEVIGESSEDESE
jgi:large subunit ribosomal protein L25